MDLPFVFRKRSNVGVSPNANVTVMWSQKHFCLWSFTFECLHVFLIIASQHVPPSDGEALAGVYWCSMKWRREDFSRTINTQHGFLPQLQRRRHFYHFISLPEFFPQCRCPVIYSVALCTIITVGWCSFMSDFGSENPRSTKWVTAAWNVRITQAQQQQRRTKLMKMCVFVFCSLFHRMRFLGLVKPKQITDFLVRWPSEDSNYHFLSWKYMHAGTTDWSLPKRFGMFAKNIPKALFAM